MNQLEGNLWNMRSEVLLIAKNSLDEMRNEFCESQHFERAARAREAMVAVQAAIRDIVDLDDSQIIELPVAAPKPRPWNLEQAWEQCCKSVFKNKPQKPFVIRGVGKSTSGGVAICLSSQRESESKESFWVPVEQMVDWKLVATGTPCGAIE